MSMDQKSSRKTVLVVDDVPENIAIVVSVIKDSHKVQTALDGESALALVAGARNKPDLILLDIQMPRIDGFEVCQRLKSDPKTRDIPVVFLTSLSSHIDEARGLAVGAVDYIYKPFSPSIVKMRVATHLNLKESREQLEYQNRNLQEALDQLRQTQLELVRRERLASLGTLVAGVAHELNTPIGTCLTAATTMLDNARQLAAELTSDKVKRSSIESLLPRILQAGELLERNLNRTGQIVTDFQQLAVDHTGEQRRSFDLRKLVNERVEAHLLRFQGTEHRIVQDIPAGITMDSYPFPLGQALGILLTNAFVHGFSNRAPGTVRITAEIVTGDRVRLMIFDNGHGIPTENLPRIFDPFFTTRLGQGGSGIGLHTVYGITTRTLGGQISAISTPGAGATFTVEIPRVAPELASLEPSRNG